MASEEQESNLQRVEGSGPKSVDCNAEMKKDLTNLCDLPEGKDSNIPPASGSVKANSIKNVEIMNDDDVEMQTEQAA